MYGVLKRRGLLSGLVGGVLMARPVKGQSLPSSLGILNVKDYGAVGDFVHDDTTNIQAAIDAAFGPASAPHGTNYTLNKILYFPPGRYKTTAPLAFPPIQGAQIMGAGRFATTIENVAGTGVMTTNGAAYCRWSDMYLVSQGAAIIFDLNYDGNGLVPGLQSNVFDEVVFGFGHFGCTIARSGLMGSENCFLNCHFTSNATAGLSIAGFNALQNTVIGGNIQSCGIGIWVGVGSVTLISSVGFQVQTGYDIQSDGSSGNCMVVDGCRSESKNFIKSVQNVQVNGCKHTNSALGNFLYALGGNVVVSSCETDGGGIYARGGLRLRIENSVFKRADWFIDDQLWWKPNNSLDAVIELENVSIYTGTYQQIRRQRITAPLGIVKTQDYMLTP